MRHWPGFADEVPEMRRATGKAKGARGKHDPWKEAIYTFEESWPDSEREALTLRQVRSLVGMACQAYSLKPPSVRQHRNSHMSYSMDDGSFISFRLSHKNRMVALHEAAHYIADRIYGSRAQDHGIAWQGIYFFLLARVELAPLEALRASARKHGLRWHEMPPCNV